MAGHGKERDTPLNQQQSEFRFALSNQTDFVTRRFYLRKREIKPNKGQTFQINYWSGPQTVFLRAACKVSVLPTSSTLNQALRKKQALRYYTYSELFKSL